MPLQESYEVKKVLQFLNEININVIEKELGTTFLPGLDLGPNCIYIDYNNLLYPGDILHEAGHLAVTTSVERKLIGTDKISPEWPTHGEEIAAILWSFAAAKYLNLPLEFIFHPNGYKNDSDWLISNFSNENYIGLPLLEWMGLCLGNELAAKEGKSAFPAMLKWMRD
ncbi:hypothetical protein DBB36_12140 [Flavobacterium sp. WLB]|uniref:hypothetical protein n=1 Tax=unclassified Flavobacterium TaxID=196869 RepID=UPI0006AB9950|nr:MULTISPECIES: hypothetical protein [unclassified Flavobacterium]KOP38941.1 hypothetical protein AKO67_07965 [Flavobacterium sp. VMW]OWU88235.1 hypothetical protein APR43_23965 [Flavobacterium sp. NLM]PUU69711.1 hypothetical protein DBB36_12140 [Flavobacterium sp. WLB]